MIVRRIEYTAQSIVFGCTWKWERKNHG